MANYMKHRYLLMTLDPVHIGTGGYRLGGVDNSIVREPGTRIPKIPGTSLSGAIRQYAARHAERDCAGQKGHCGKDSCPICYTFGFVKGEGEEAKGRSGVVNIFDAHILFFPVYSMMGPVWVTTRQRLEDAGFNGNLPEPSAGKVLFTFDRTDPLNLGWLMVEGSKISNELTPPDEQNKNERWKTIQGRLVIVPDNLFGQVVNSNLEVRTSVSINPETGAAESGGLFTYEAIPRSTFLMAEIIQDDYKAEFPGNQNGWKQPLDVVKTGLKMIEYLGVGGMGTRGFGRVAMVGEPHPIKINFGGNNNG